MSWIALAAAYVMLVQALLAGSLLGPDAALASTGLPQIICSQGAGNSTPAAPARSPHRSDCCLFGCPMLGPLAILPADMAPVQPPRLAAAAHKTARADAGPLARPECAPLQSRAPPHRA